MDLIQKIHKYLEDDIKLMNEHIMSILATREELVSVIGNHIANAGGKRIRPILTLLSAQIFISDKNKNAILLATAVEFIHAATLLHDDVVDGSKMRRKLPTANVIWGSKASILVGDFLFSQSFKLMVATNSMKCLSVLSTASAVIAEGEVSQLMALESKKMINDDDYIKIIESKTAELFAASCEVGAIISDQDDAVSSVIRNFGLILGKIFQITDDLIDYFSDTETSGKNIGDDFLEGKITMPLILLHKKLAKDGQDKIMSLVNNTSRTYEDFLIIVNLLKTHNIRSEIQTYLLELKAVAELYLRSLESHVQNHEAIKFLYELIDFAIYRDY